MKLGASALVVALCIAVMTGASTSVRRDLRGADGLVRAYDFILDARFDQVEPELRKACGPAPGEACDVLAATALWWRIQLDPHSTALDAAFSTLVEKAIASTEAWAARAPTDAEAWFYMGGAYAARVQWRVLRDQKLSAARDGKRILQAFEESLRLDATLDDAYFGMGMYKYYADVAPAAARMLRFLLLLPGGDRKVGLEQMRRARARGQLLQGEADYQLSIVYLWYENQTPGAINLLQALNDQYPGNPLFLSQIAHIQDAYQHDITASLATWRTLLAAAREQRANLPTLAETQARLGIARMLEVLHQTDDAVEQLQAVIARRPDAPFGSLALAYLKLGEAHDRVGARADAVEAYTAALEVVPSEDPHDIRATANGHLRRAPNAKAAEAYRHSLEGLRRFEQDDLGGAASALERSLALNSQAPVARYRLGRVMQAMKQDPAALAQFEMAIRQARQGPAPVIGNAYLEAARLLERAGKRDAALSYYRIASSLFGAASDTRAAATRAVTRLRTGDARPPR